MSDFTVSYGNDGEWGWKLDYNEDLAHDNFNIGIKVSKNHLNDILSKGNATSFNVPIEVLINSSNLLVRLHLTRNCVRLKHPEWLDIYVTDENEIIRAQVALECIKTDKIYLLEKLIQDHMHLVKLYARKAAVQVQRYDIVSENFLRVKGEIEMSEKKIEISVSKFADIITQVTEAVGGCLTCADLYYAFVHWIGWFDKEYEKQKKETKE